MPRFFIGCISGTSIDGLDIALVDIEAKPAIAASKTVSFPELLEDELRHLLQPGPNEIFRLGLAHARLGEFIGTSILSFLNDNDLDAGDIAAIGSHGQTIRHHPDSDPGFSVQIGSGSHIAEITGIDTITDFRSRDLASGGEGAPLVPSFHRMLFHPYEHDQVILNIGGIANVTILYSHEQQPFVGFDTGPGNALLDAWVNDSRQLR
jgi:anhydro-N-acetylmuramic acid kinase